MIRLFSCACGIALLLGSSTTRAQEGAAKEALVSYGTLRSNPPANIALEKADLDAAADANALLSGARLSLFTAVRDPVEDPMGATFEPVSESLRAQLAIPTDQGLIVAALANDGPAARAGLLQNDILLKLADKPLMKAGDLADRLGAGGNSDLALNLLRAGKPVTLTVRPSYRVTFAAADEKGTPDYYIGVGVEPLDDALRAHLSIPDGQGLLANQIIEGSPAEKAGVKTHDILLDLGDKPLDSTETLIAQVQATKGKSSTLKVLRAGKPLSIAITPEPRKQQEKQDAHFLHERLYRLGVQGHPELMTENLTGVGPWHQPVSLWSKDGQVVGWHGAMNATGHGENLGARLDTLDKDVKALRKAVEEIRDVLTKQK
jgi:hypothetical protein